MKKLILINGTMGAGKTTTCQELLKLLQPSVFLDGDWCWNMNPFIVNEETKQMVLKNICFMLNSFINCSEYKYIIFCWVMHQQEIIDDILKHLNLDSVETHTITLTLTEEALTKRLGEDIAQKIRQPDVLERSISRIVLYNDMDTIKVDVSNITPFQAAKKIVSHLKS
ncbi:MAG: AAA family ATPase [Clostridiaceae bacterium]|nr:AAA family ATPase [Clostridiaceae bacterium]